MPVTTEVQGRVLVVRLDRDAKLNAMDHAMTLGLDAAMNRLEDDDAIWVGVLTGAGRAFSAGSDLADPDRNSTERGGPYGLVRRARRKPLVAAVNGLAYGGGFEMVLACDLVVAARSARFALPEVKRGLFALYGGVFRAAHALPPNLARELALTGEPIDAARAHALGLVNRLCDDNEVLPTALALAESICANSPVAVRESLGVINRSIDAAQALAWQLSAEAAAAVRASDDSREGIAAFLGKRAPRWSGR
ncbi:MAG TPA: enoyl-CoA hydratase-related protein [Rubrivivax sp.]|nr:enoyl-CoA hydratase/isomerase family protein [Rubrivivax sp.]HOW48205.1 enoyl-CoA hydratase-related protein [Rubrivivax sp.]HRZ60223.1 enoyl-CoA hydratase-related protein [Rubrivivax sp.]